jgi:hypothetical protein
LLHRKIRDLKNIIMMLRKTIIYINRKDQVNQIVVQIQYELIKKMNNKVYFI